MSNCIFCRIAEKSAAAEIIAEKELCLAFADIVPVAPEHIVVIPKRHVEKVQELSGNELAAIFGTIAEITQAKNVDKTGFRVILNYGHNAGQVVPHLHFHVLGGRGFSWPPG